MKKLTSIFSVCLAVTFTACGPGDKKTTETASNHYDAKPIYKLYDDPNRFADIEIIRYNVDGFDNLTLNQKLLVYYLSEAALSGRDMIFDQNNKNNLRLRKALEELYVNYEGDKTADDFRYFEVYLKRFWMNNGIHHHYAETKINPEFSSQFIETLIQNSPKAKLPLVENDTAAFKTWMIDIMYNPNSNAKRVNKDENVDNITASANNFYENVTNKEVKDFYDKIKVDSLQPISLGLNSKLIKKDGQITEKVWKVGGMYSASIEKIVSWLEKAITVAESPQQAQVFQLLIDFYKSGDLKTWDEYNIAWVKDVNNSIDFINGFIEVYHDAIGMRANYESAVEIKDFEASRRMSIIAKNAQWFENNSPILPEHKKEKVVGITYNVISVAMEAGDLAPSTAIGINLPNAEWIRETHGSKSVSLGNITAAYDNSNSGGLLAEFCYDSVELNRAKQYGRLAGDLHTAMHEVIGHASGKMNEGVTKTNLGTYGSTLEEARADLVALYYLLDPKMIEIGVMPNLEVGKAEYDNYIRNGLMMQLRRLEAGANLEEDHMRNRQMVAAWVYEKGKADNVIEKKTKDGKTFFVINDYNKLRTLFGEILSLIQSIKSRGAGEEGKQLVENYGVKVDKDLHAEVLNRSKALDIAPYKGFIQPRYSLVMEGDKIVDVKIDYEESYVDQMLRLGRDYNFLPFEN